MVVSVTHLCTGVGTGKQDTRALAGKGASGARAAKGAEALDDALDGALLAETGLAEGRQGDEKE